MHLSTVKIPVNFGLDLHCPSVSFLISKPILHQPEKMLFASFLLYILEWDHPFQVTPHMLLVWGDLQVESFEWSHWSINIFYTVFRQWKCDRTITICVNAYRKQTVRTILTNMWHRSTIDIGLDNRKPWMQAGTPWPELDHNTGRHFDTPPRLVTSRPSFRQTRHLASHNISTIVHETSKFRYTWRESWCNCVWKTLYLIFTLNSPA